MSVVGRDAPWALAAIPPTSTYLTLYLFRVDKMWSGSNSSSGFGVVMEIERSVCCVQIPEELLKLVDRVERLAFEGQGEVIEGRRCRTEKLSSRRPRDARCRVPHAHDDTSGDVKSGSRCCS